MATRSRFSDPRIKPLSAWPASNQACYAAFRDWLIETGYGPSALQLYTVAARLAFGLLEQPWRQLDPEKDLEPVREYIAGHYGRQGTRETYLKGLAKLTVFLRRRNHTPTPEKALNWPYYLRGLPAWLQADVREHAQHTRRGWALDRQWERMGNYLSHLTRGLRWLSEHEPFASLDEIAPRKWLAYADSRLAEGIHLKTLNIELYWLQALLRWVAAQGRPVNAQMLALEQFTVERNLPKDVPAEQLRKVLAEVEKDATSKNPSVRQLGLMDRAWVLLMLHCGLRTGEVRRLLLSDVLWEQRQVRIEESKGLNDRHVYLSPEALAALRAYLAVREREAEMPENLFVFRHFPLGRFYCRQRLVTYGRRCGVHVTPHQLRHSCATMLLNAGAPIVTVQKVLGHRYIDTTLGYARLYDGTVAADYYGAMAQIEKQMKLPEGQQAGPLHVGQLVALVDSLRRGTLNDAQAEAVRALRAGLLAMAEGGKAKGTLGANGSVKTG